MRGARVVELASVLLEPMLLPLVEPVALLSVPVAPGVLGDDGVVVVVVVVLLPDVLDGVLVVSVLLDGVVVDGVVVVGGVLLPLLCATAFTPMATTAAAAKVLRMVVGLFMLLSCH